MSLENYTHLSSWMGRYARQPSRISPDVAATPEGKAALEALNDLDQLLRHGDIHAMKELFKLTQRDQWLLQSGCADDSKDRFYDLPQTD